MSIRTNIRHKTTIYLPPEVVHVLKDLAEKHDRSLNGEILQALRHYIESESLSSKKEVQSAATPTN